MKKRIISLLCVMAMLLALMCGAVYAAEDVVIVGEPVVYGAGWQQYSYGTGLWDTMPGDLDPAFMAEGGQMNIVVSGTDIWQVYYVMQGNSNGWCQIAREFADMTDNGDGTYTATFTYEECAAAYGAAPTDLAAVYICTNAGGEVTVHSAVYSAGETAPEETEPEVTEPEVTEPEVTEPEVTEPEVTEPEVTVPDETVPEESQPEVEQGAPQGQNILGSAVTSNREWDADTACVYTNLWGGSFNPSKIVSGGTFYITYEGEMGKVKLALNGSSWQEIEPTSLKAYGNGWVASFSYDDCVAAYGSDFSGLGAVHAFIMDATPMTVTGIYWYAPGDSNNPQTGVLLPVAAAIVGTASILGLGITIHKRKEMN